MTGDNALWVTIQQEYIKTGTKYTELAEKYGISISTLKKKAALYKWKEKRAEALKLKKERKKEPKKELKKVPEKVPTVYADMVLDAEGDRERFARIVEDMLNRVEDAICVVDVHNTASIKLLTAALKDLRELKDLNRTELDIEEQKARIAKLKSDTRIVETEESGGVVFMPVMDARPVPPEDKQ